MKSKSAVLEVLFTPQWAAIYDPVSRERWHIEALENEAFFNSLCNGVNSSAVNDEDGILERAGLIHAQPYSRSDASEWIQAGWTDALRHYLHTNNLPKLSYADAAGWSEDFRTMQEKIEESDPPPHAKQYDPAFARFLVTGKVAANTLREIFNSNPRASGKRDLNREVLGHLLTITFGVTGYKNLAVTGRHVQKTSPSGGSRHPTEAYVLVFDIPEMTEGIYHFDSIGNQLVLLQEGDFLSRYMEEVFGLNRRISFAPRASIVMTSMAERSMHRYRDSRSYRVLHFDVGHLMLSCQLIARAEKLKYLSSYSIAEKAAEDILGIDGLHETAISQILFG